MNKLQAIWDAIPAQIRTVINVGVTGAIVVVIGAITLKQGVTGVNWSDTGRSALDAAGLGVATAIFRSLNPLDSAYGTGSSSSATVTAGPSAEDIAAAQAAASAVDALPAADPVAAVAPVA